MGSPRLHSTVRPINCRIGPRNRHWPRKGVERKKRHFEEIYYTRELLFNAQGGLCAICGTPLDPVIHRATTDHVIPLALEGKDAFGNFVAVHRKCNTWKANDLPTGCELVWLLAVNAKLGAAPVHFLPAQGGEARQGGDGEAGSVHEHPVAEGHAPAPTPDQFTSPSAAMSHSTPAAEGAGVTGRAG